MVVPAANVSLAVSGNPVAGGAAAQFTVTVSPATGVTIQNVMLRYGDGAQDDLGVVSGAPVMRSHTYASGGTFTASVIVTISGGTGPLNTQPQCRGCRYSYVQHYLVVFRHAAQLAGRNSGSHIQAWAIGDDPQP